MTEPEPAPVRSEAPELTVARLARSLGVPTERVEAALAAVGVSPADAFTSILHGKDEARVERLAKELHVSRPRLALALLDGAVQSASSWAGNAGLADKARGAVERATEWMFDVLEFLLEIFAETIPRILRRITLTLVLLGAAFGGLGILALVDPPLFMRVVYYAVAIGLVAFGAGFIWVAWRIHEATASLRTLARLAKKWRERVNARRE